MKVIGVTGGMASGKSTIVRMIARDKYPYLDADLLVHELMISDEETIDAIGAKFPSAIVDGMVSRAELTSLIGQGIDVMPALEKILHPIVRQAEERAIELAREQGHAAVLLDIPLLFETGADALCDHVIAVCAPLEVRKERAFSRAGMTQEKWDKLIARQWTDEQRAQHADAVVHSDAPIEQTRQEVGRILRGWSLL